MTRLPVRLSSIAGAIGLIAVLIAGCAAPYGGYGYEDPGFGADYYEPYGTVYGGWGPGYAVGPYRDNRGGFGRGGVDRGVGHAASAQHAFRAAPAGRATPSIPSGARGGGGRGGGTRH
jgi:hypothetical protein